MKTMRWACDFCGKTQDEVQQIIAGPRDIAICGECVEVCVDVIAEAKANGTAATQASAPETRGEES